MLQITSTLALPDDNIEFRFKRASGPGGQNVNKVSTAVELRFDVMACEALTTDIKQRLIALAGNRLNTQGVLLIEAQRFRTQAQNRRDALARLSALIRAAAIPPKQRIATRVSRAARLSRLESKRRQSQIKHARRPAIHLED